MCIGRRRAVDVIVGADVRDDAAHAVEHVGECARHEVTRLADHLVRDRLSYIWLGHIR